MKKNMEAQMNFQKELILKQRQAQLATQIALGRARFQYFRWFCATVFPLLIIGAIKKKNPQLIAPMFPLSFAYAYQYDMFYGDMLERAQQEADQMIIEVPTKFYLPEHSGIVSKKEYEKMMNIVDGKKVI
jgi:hypothetical protein